MKNKDIDERNAQHQDEVEYADQWCKECQLPFWTGIDGFCSESCKDLHEYDAEMEIWRQEEEERKKMREQRMAIEELIHAPFKDREHEKVNNLRRGKTLPLGG
jgi:hypothetical protein